MKSACQGMFSRLNTSQTSPLSVSQYLFVMVLKKFKTLSVDFGRNMLPGNDLQHCHKDKYFDQQENLRHVARLFTLRTRSVSGLATSLSRGKKEKEKCERDL